MKFDRVGAFVLLVLGVLTLGVGAYFAFFRPPLLPEDIRLIGVDPRLLPPTMLDWLRIVFQTWAGFVLGFGVLILANAGYMLTARTALLRWGVALALLVAFGRFLASNILVRSDYLWFIGVLFAVALFASSLLVLDAWSWRSRRSESANCLKGGDP
jgi:hypothetical protein